MVDKKKFEDFETSELFLNALQDEAEKLVLLLRDRQVGLFGWNAFFHERMVNINSLTTTPIKESE